MMRTTLLLAILAAAPAWAGDKKLPGDLLCDDDLQICNEDCSMEYGTKASQHERVTQCLYRCDQAHTVCLQRQIAKRAATPRATEAPEKKKAAEKEEYFSGAPTRFSQEEPVKAAPPEQAEEVAPVRRTVTRANELNAAPENDPAAYPEREGFVTKSPVPKQPPPEPEGAADEAAVEKEPVEEPDPKAAPASAKTKRRKPANELGY